MNRFFLSVCCLLGLSLSAPVVAQQADSTVLTLDQVLEIALTENPEIKIADKTIQTKRYEKMETITGLFPTIKATAAGSKSIILQKMKLDFAPEPISMGQPFVYNLTGEATMPLVAPKLWKTISLNETEVQLAIEEARASKINTIASVKNAYYQLLLARESYDALLASLRTAERNAKDTKAKFEFGKVSEYDKLQADVQLASIKPNVLSAKNGVKMAEMQLKVLMGVDVAEPLKFAGRLTDYEEDLFGDLMRLKADTSLINNSDLRQLDYQARLIKMGETINRLGYFPSMALQFSAGYQSMQREFSPTKGRYFPSATVAVAFEWTIFDGLSKMMKSKQNRLKQENIELKRDNVVRKLELSVISSLNNIETAAEQVVSNKESVYSAERAHSISEKRYSVGSGTMLEVTSAETALLTARLQYAESIFSFLSNRTELEKTLGKAITDK